LKEAKHTMNLVKTKLVGLYSSETNVDEAVFTNSFRRNPSPEPTVVIRRTVGQ
jgi:hypothetical protein